MIFPDPDDVTMTMGDPSTAAESGDGTAPGLTILWHPDTSRVGERATLGRQTPVSRLTPRFAQDPWANGRPLGDPYVSREPVVISLGQGSVRIEGSAVVDGRPLDGAATIDEAAFERGVVIELARRVLLLLHRVPTGHSRAPRFGLVGENPAMRRLRDDIARVGPTGATVLVRGESGSGKELVARAVHDASRREDGPYRAVNVAAVPPTVAASAFFGHARGAFSGADRDRAGYFGESDGGTLFLDEIGALPAELQPLLLRALETGEVQPVGAPRARRVDVRIVAATDADLDAAVRGGRFSVPLLHRLSGLELFVPPLRRRIDDIPRLLLFALRRELETLGAVERLSGDPRARRPWLDAAAVGLLVRYPWPGNVRELLNVARQIAVAGHDQPRVRVSRVAALARMRDARQSADSGEFPLSTSHDGRGRGGSADDGERGAPTPEPADASDGASSLTRPAVLAALKAAGWSVYAAARALDTPRTSLYRYIEAHGLMRKASDIPDAEVLAAWRETGGDRDAMSDRLQVSTRALAFRLKDLDLPDP